MPFKKVDIKQEIKEKCENDTEFLEEYEKLQKEQGKYATGGLIEDEDREKILKQTVEAEGYIFTNKQTREFSRIIEILNKIYAGKDKDLKGN